MKTETLYSFLMLEGKIVLHRFNPEKNKYLVLIHANDTYADWWAKAHLEHKGIYCKPVKLSVGWALELINLVTFNNNKPTKN